MAHKADIQKQTLQKSLPCSDASKTQPTSLDTYFQFDKPKEGLPTTLVLPKCRLTEAVFQLL